MVFVFVVCSRTTDANSPVANSPVANCPVAISLRKDLLNACKSTAQRKIYKVYTIQHSLVIAVPKSPSTVQDLVEKRFFFIFF